MPKIQKEDALVSSWHLDAPRALFSAPSALPQRVDVAVIGGGVMGTAACYWLASTGLQVALLEAHWLGFGASGRNAGLVLAGSGPLEDPAVLRRVCEVEQIDVCYTQPGHLALASSPTVWEHIQDEVARRSPTQSPLYALDRAACEDLLHLRIAPRFYGGRWLPSGAMLHPMRFVYGLAVAAQRHGASIAPQTIARTISRRRDGGIVVETNRGALQAREVICACNAMTRTLLPALARCFEPIRGQMLATDPLPRLFRMGMAVDWGSVYWRQADHGAILLGGYRGLDPEPETGCVAELNPRIQAALEAFLPEAFPGFPAFRVRRRWAGIMDETRDGRPIIGAVPDTPNCWVIAGFGGHGLPGALGASKALTDRITAGTSSVNLQAYDPARFSATRPQSAPVESGVE